MTGQWIKLHNELLILFSLPNIIRVIRLRRMSLLELVPCSGGRVMHMLYFLGKMKDYQKDLG